jgi:hypothetical protein
MAKGKNMKRRVALFSSILLSLTHVHASRAADVKSASQQKKTSLVRESREVARIRVTDGDWGKASARDIEILLNRVAAELLRHFPGRQLDPIVVSHSRSGPVVLYQKSPKNEYQVYLAAQDERWAEYVYEFSHELVHILANYQYHAPPHEARHQWFEETLCESASLYALKKFSLSWEQAAPRPGWHDYAPAFHRFTQRALTEPHRQLPANMTFLEWFQQNGAKLTGNPHRRNENELIANLLLPVLEQNPDWRALAYLNLEQSEHGASFYHHLMGWHKNTPAANRELVAETLKIFHFHEKPAESRLAGNATIVMPEIGDGAVAVGVAGRPGH